MIRVISISAVADGPETNVVANAAVPRNRAIASGTVSTTSSARTRHKVIVRHQRHSPPSLPRDILQHNRPRLRNRQRRSVSTPSNPFNSRSRKSRHPPQTRHPSGSHSGFNPAGTTIRLHPALRQHPRHTSRYILTSSPNHMRVIVPQPIFQQLQHQLMLLCVRTPPILPRELPPTSPEQQLHPQHHHSPL